MMYVEEALGKYLSDTDYASLSGVTLSDAFELYDLETMETCNKDVFVAYYEDTVIGIMCVSSVDGGYYSTFRQQSPVCIQNAYDSEMDIAFCCNNGESLIFDGVNFYDTQTDEVTDYSFENELSMQLNSLDAEYGQFQPYVSSNARVSVVMNAELDSYYFHRVENQSINGGICWAASIATKYNYENGYLEGDSGYKDAMDVYTAISVATGSTPVGTAHYYKIGLSMYGLLDTCYADSISGTAVYTELSHDNAVIIDVSGTGGAHSLVIGGMRYYDDNTAVYTVADSNFPELMEAYVDSNADLSSEDFKYGPEGYGFVFTNWYQTYSFRSENTHINS